MDHGVTSLPADAYPALLREIPRPPKELRYRGAVPPGSSKYLTVVGSRSCTKYGEQVVHTLLAGLKDHAIVIVSGLAYGVDTLAHTVALEHGLMTIAVPGSGLDWNVLYPRVNVQLAHRILDQGGTLLSEFDDSLRATDWTFPQRNRLMAGMSHATIVIEAKEKSGSLITAKLATDFNRELLVVPGSIFSAESAGVHQFLKLGATPVTESNDILRALGLAEKPRTIARVDVSEDEMRVLDFLSNPMHKNELLERLGMPIDHASSVLSLMEIKGLIVEEVGYVRAV